MPESGLRLSLLLFPYFRLTVDQVNVPVCAVPVMNDAEAILSGVTPNEIRPVSLVNTVI